MRILFTGASSFTGYWFINALIDAGHEVVGTFRRRAEDYDGVRGLRVNALADRCERVWECTFGDERFFDLLDSWRCDLLCHHAAEVTGYRRPDFPLIRAVAQNTDRAREVLATLRARGCRRLLLTGTVFEPGEGAGTQLDLAVSPYGLSKRLTAEVFRHECHWAGMTMGKFVIANPFGPYEEPRFTSYLVRCWLAGDVATVRTPAYIRDNMHVSLLARAYVDFANSIPDNAGFSKLNPSGYAESQADFAQRFADAMRRRLDVACPLEFAPQTQFNEPRIRINTDTVNASALQWDESASWDALADYYARAFDGSHGVVDEHAESST